MDRRALLKSIFAAPLVAALPALAVVSIVPVKGVAMGTGWTMVKDVHTTIHLMEPNEKRRSWTDTPKYYAINQSGLELDVTEEMKMWGKFVPPEDITLRDRIFDHGRAPLVKP